MKEFNIKDNLIGGERTFVIAEAGSNHGGDFEQAKELVDVAVEAGADAVKFQSYEGDSLVSRDRDAHETLDKYGLPYEWHHELNEYCKEKDIIFCSSVFDYEKLNWLVEVDAPFIKVASGDLTYLPFLKEIAMTNKPIVLSTGMATLGEIEEAVQTITNENNEKLAILHCVGRYPTEEEEVNLRVLETLEKTFGFPVGFSDHTETPVIPAMAVSMGAKVIEKHFTLDKDLDTPDHSFALRPDELKEMVKLIRLAEDVKGSKYKEPTESEKETSRTSARRSIHSAKEVKEGEIISEDKVKVIRPAEGLAPKMMDDLLGNKAKVDIPAEKALELSDIDW